MSAGVVALEDSGAGVTAAHAAGAVTIDLGATAHGSDLAVELVLLRLG